MSNRRRNINGRWQKLFDFVHGRQDWSFRKANLRGADLRGVNASYLNFNGADMTDARLSNADFFSASMQGVTIRGRYNHDNVRFEKASLRGAVIESTFYSGLFRETGLTHANIGGSKFFNCNMAGANMSYAKADVVMFDHCQLKMSRMVKMRVSETLIFDYCTTNMLSLRDARINRVVVRGGMFYHSDLSGMKGLKRPSEWLRENFKRDPETGCYIVYKARFSGSGFEQPSDWKWEPGAVFREYCNPDVGTLGGCGVNFGTLEYVRRFHGRREVWACLLTGVPVVPLGTNWNARSDELTLMYQVDEFGRRKQEA